MTSASQPQSSEEHVVNEFGYRQELRRTLRLFSVFAVAFSIISITTGIFLNYSFAYMQLGPVSIWTWPVAAVGQTLVVLVLAELATRIPLAGANYQWASRLVGPTYGWFVGALGVLNLAVGLPGIMLLAASPLLAFTLGNDAPTPRLTLFLALLILTIAYLVNVISVQVAARVNNVAVFTEILGTVVLAVALFVLWVADYKETDHGIDFLGQSAHPPGQSFWYSVVLASLLGIYTIVAFETAADMSEEAVDAQRSVPRAMIGAVVISGVLGMIVLIGFTIAVPNDAVIAEFGLPGVFQYWIGAELARTFVGIVVFSMFALTVVGGAASARLLYAMARDNMLPGSKALAKVNPRTLTPLPALLVSYLLCVCRHAVRLQQRERLRDARGRDRPGSVPRLPAHGHRLRREASAARDAAGRLQPRPVRGAGVRGGAAVAGRRGAGAVPAVGVPPGRLLRRRRSRARGALVVVRRFARGSPTARPGRRWCATPQVATVRGDRNRTTVPWSTPGLAQLGT
ncbi:MAG: amino acid permease [Nocardioidaceae bacterium]